MSGYFEQSLSFRQNFIFNMIDRAGFGIEHYTAWNNNIELFFFLFKIQDPNLSFNRRNNEGITPLMMASLGGKSEMVEVLVSVVDVNLQDRLGNTAMHYAVTKQNIVIVKILLDRPDLDFDLKN